MPCELTEKRMVERIVDGLKNGVMQAAMRVTGLTSLETLRGFLSKYDDVANWEAPAKPERRFSRKVENQKYTEQRASNVREKSKKFKKWSDRVEKNATRVLYLRTRAIIHMSVYASIANRNRFSASASSLYTRQYAFLLSCTQYKFAA